MHCLIVVLFVVVAVAIVPSSHLLLVPLLPLSPLLLMSLSPSSTCIVVVVVGLPPMPPFKFDCCIHLHPLRRHHHRLRRRQTAADVAQLRCRHRRQATSRCLNAATASPPPSCCRRHAFVLPPPPQLPRCCHRAAAVTLCATTANGHIPAIGGGRGPGGLIVVLQRKPLKSPWQKYCIFSPPSSNHNKPRAAVITHDGTKAATLSTKNA